MFDPAALAKSAVFSYVRGGAVVEPPADLPERFRRPSAAFVCIKKGGKLRGCIGTFAPNAPTLAQEIIDNAVGSATRDGRFSPIYLEELEELEFSVDVLEPPERIRSIDDLDPKKYGVIIRSGQRLGLLLPDLEGVGTAQEQVVIAKRKAGIAEWEEGELFRFQVTRYGA